MSATSIVNYLKQSDIFYKFSATQLELVANLCQEISLKDGEIIFRENSNSNELSVITSGEVQILIEGKSGEESLMATLKRGQSFGEVALVDEGLRSATARAGNKQTSLLVIQREKLIMLCETYPQLGHRLMYNLATDLATKIRNTDLRIREAVIYAPKSPIN